MPKIAELFGDDESRYYCNIEMNENRKEVHFETENDRHNYSISTKRKFYKFSDWVKQ